MPALKPNRDRLIADTQALVRIPSVNPYDEPATKGTREQEVADWLSHTMENMGLEVFRHEVTSGRPNVWGVLKGKGSAPRIRLMLAGHMDTVFVEGYEGDPFDPRFENGRIYGRGSVDMKGPLATFLETMRLAKSMDLSGDLILAFVVDEEDKMTGSLAAAASGLTADFCIVGEPSNLTVATAHKGQFIAKIEVTGQACHSSNPRNGINAISATADLIAHMQAYDAELQARDGHALCGSAFYTPTLSGGGETHSNVPNSAWVTFDRRVLPGETEDTIRAEIQTHLDQLNASSQAQFKLQPPLVSTKPLNVDPQSRFVKTVLRAASKATGSDQIASAFPGSTDAPNFGCPALICGPGDLGRAHTSNEFIEVDQMEKAVGIYLDVIQELLA